MLRNIRIPKKRNVFCDLSRIQRLTIDAVMYFIAVLANKNVRVQTSGNEPFKASSRKLLRDSGFYRYVKARNFNSIQRTNHNILQIRSGNKNIPKIVKEVCDFVNEACGTGLEFTKDLYRIVHEMMSKTVQHAYENKSKLRNNWYIFVEIRYNILKFVFLDTGEGIPDTIRKKAFEDLYKGDSQFIYSALKGEYRTRTGEIFRGRGLPCIYSKYKDGFIENLRILSCHGNCAFNSPSDEPILMNMNNSISGTLFYWEIKKRGKQNVDQSL